MKKANYCALEEHKKHHKEFSNKIMNIDIPALAEQPYVELKKIKEMLIDWIFDHMMREDIAMVNEIRNTVPDKLFHELGMNL